MFHCNPYGYSSSAGARGEDTTEQSWAEMRARLRQKLDILSSLRELTAEVDRMRVRHATPPPATCAEFLTAIREQAGLIARFDDAMKAFECSARIHLPTVVARAQVLLTGALRQQGQPGQPDGRAAMPPAPLERLARYLTEMTALLDQLPSLILKDLDDPRMEDGGREYHLSDPDLSVPATVLDAFDFLERLHCCREDLDAPAGEAARQRLDALEARQPLHLDDPDALEPLRQALVEIHQAMCRAYRPQQPEDASAPLLERASRDRQQRGRDIAAAIDAGRQLLARMEAFAAGCRA